MLPDKQLAGEQEAAEKQKLAERLQGMSDTDKDTTVSDTANLKQRQVRLLSRALCLLHAACRGCRQMCCCMPA